MIQKKILGFLESQAEKGGLLGKLVKDFFPIIYIAIKNPKNFKKNLESYFSYKKLYDFNSDVIRFSTIGAANELGILKILDNWKPWDEIKEKLGLDENRLEALLDALAYFGIAEKRIKSGKSFYRVKSFPNNIGFIWAQMKGLSQLPKIIKEGKPSENLDIYNLEGEYAELLYSVNSFLHTATKELMRKFKFENIKRIMVGSMGISFARNIQKAFPDVQINIGCYPHLIKLVPNLILKYKIPQTSIASIKGHKGVPSEDKWGDEEKGYDLIFLTKKLSLRSLNEFGNEFLGKSFNLLNSGGYAVIWESIVDDSGTKGPIEESILDLLTSYTGKRWKESEIKSYVKSFGFRRTDLVRCLAGKTTFLVAVK